MSELSAAQLRVLRRIGVAADESQFRSHAVSRTIEASMAHRRDCLHRLDQIAHDVARNQMRAYARDPPTAVALAKLDQEASTLRGRVAAAEKQLDESRQSLHQLAMFSSPLKATLEVMLKRGRLSALDLGIPYAGMDTPREAVADVVITDSVAP